MREHVSALFIILEHVQTGACRGKQNGIAALSQTGAVLDSGLYGIHTNQRNRFAQGLSDQFGIAPQQYCGAAMLRNRRTQSTKVGTFAIATGNQNQLAFDIRTKAFDGSQCGTDVGGFGIVVVMNAVVLSQPLAAMLKPGEFTQAGEHGIEGQPHGVPERQRCKGIGLIVRAPDFQFTDRHEVFELERQVLFAVLFAQTETVEVGLVETECPARQAFANQRTGQRILTIDHHLPGTSENPVLGQVVGRQTAVAVHVVLADVQHGRHFSVELVGGFELKAGQLHHVQFDIVAEQVQRWSTQVAPYRNAFACSDSHFAYQRRYRTFRIRTGNGDDRCLRVTREQLDVTGQFDAARVCLLQGRCGQRQAGADVQFVGTAEKIHVQLATTHFHLRIVATQGRQLRRILPRVGHGKGHAPVRQKANQGHATFAKPHNNAEAVGNDQGHSFYLSFSVARPMSTRITVMIQKRTITRGSGQPLSSKW
ncbi:hypothetical protein ALP93_05443 [Pseudomonas syringae pv. helianthi]|nr:hypothetical protein ALP93_05443 [Pseudomonas syringae pv. helianthi]